MPIEYRCYRCGKFFDHKGDYVRHMNRKTSCKRAQDSDYYCKVCHRTFVTRSNLNRHMTGTKCAGKVTKIVETLACPHCHKMFKRHSNWKKHVTEYCPKVLREEAVAASTTSEVRIDEPDETRTTSSIDDDLESLSQIDDGEMIDRLIDKLCQKKSEMSGTTNISISDQRKIINDNKVIRDSQVISDSKINSDNTFISNNVQQNNEIKLLAFGQEDLSHITDNLYKKILNMGFRAVPEFINKLHFYKAFPKNHNVYITNLRDQYARIYNGEQWVMEDKLEVVDRLYEDKKYHLEGKFNELSGELEDYTVNKFNRFLRTNPNATSIKNVKADIKRLLYNNRGIPEATAMTMAEQMKLEE